MSATSEQIAAPCVLYIDDDEALGVLLRRNLARRGFSVLGAETGRQGLDILAGGGIAAVALDHYLGIETGLDVLPNLLATAAPPPVIYMTGTSDFTIIQQALDQGAAAHVAKTLGTEFFDQLARALSLAIEQARRPA